VAIYDIRNPKEGPIIQSGFETGKHNDPIWKVQWVDHSSEHGESLVSVSTDGRVSQWSIKKVCTLIEKYNPKVERKTLANMNIEDV
jgi:WD40 repeat protein